MLKIEFDDGKPIKWSGERAKQCTRKGRLHGFYLIYSDGFEEKIEISYMKISEMEYLETLLNKVHSDGSIQQALHHSHTEWD